MFWFKYSIFSASYSIIDHCSFFFVDGEWTVVWNCHTACQDKKSTRFISVIYGPIQSGTIPYTVPRSIRISGMVPYRAVHTVGFAVPLSPANAHSCLKLCAATSTINSLSSAFNVDRICLPTSAVHTVPCWLNIDHPHWPQVSEVMDFTSSLLLWPANFWNLSTTQKT